jgi:chromosome segregation ATPase
MGKPIMNHGHRSTPEGQELEKKLEELASLEGELIQRELDLATLRAELAEFESRYLRTVGVLYAELDEIEAQIVEAQARRKPSDFKAQAQAGRARAQAQESSETARAIAEPKP